MRVALRRFRPALVLTVLVAGSSGAWATVPLGFQDTVVTSSVFAPSVLAFAPDGRLFVGEKNTGRVRIIEGSTLLETPFLDLDAGVPAPSSFDNFFERGLLGIAFHPSFESNGFVYVYYTICKASGGGGSCTSVNRVSRFTASGNTAVAGSEEVILDDIGSDAGNHNAGWIDFGPDGKLYVAVGDGGQINTKAQDLGTLNGKVLRLEADGSIPADNPFIGLPGVREEIWASGFRNPWRCRFQPLGDRLFCADVGQSTWEEVDIVEAGENYGWPVTEGPFDQDDFAYAHPIDWYGHNGSASITGGDFGARTNFPGDHQQSYFYADFVLGFIRRAILDETGSLVVDVQDFATGLGGNSVTDLVAGPDGDLYYANYSTNQVRRISATASPVAVAGATPTSGLPELAVQFSGDTSTLPAGSPTFFWDFDDGSTSTEANPLHTFTAEGLYTVTLTVNDADGATPPGVDTVEITVGQPPVVTITAPSDGQQFAAGDTVTLTGSADDPAADLAWEVIFHHNTHIHPFLSDLPGGEQSFVWATSGEAAADVGYEIILRATAASGLVGEARRVVLPILGEFTLASSPSGRVVTLDGQPRTTPFTIEGVVGFERTIGVPSATGFLGWSDGGAATHTIATPAAPTTFAASFTDPCASPTVIPAAGGVLTGTTAGNSGLAGTCGGGTAPETVFSWTPSASGTAIIETCGAGTAYDTVLFVREASCTGTQVGCNDDTVGCATTSGATHGSQVGLSVSAGTTYFIVVDGFQARAGDFSLTVVPPGAAPTTTSSTTSTSTTSSTNSTALTTSTSTTSTTDPTAPSTTSTSSSSTTTASGLNSTTTSTVPSTTSTSTTSSSTTTVPTTSSTAPRATSTTTSTVPAPRCDPTSPSACDDGDACTDDHCDPAVGCISMATPDVDCVVVNLRSMVEAVPGCGIRCARAMARDLKRVERAGAEGGARCRQRLKQAARAARSLAARIGRLGGEEALVLEAERLQAEIEAQAAATCPSALRR